jgi:2-methylcitrate synthase
MSVFGPALIYWYHYSNSGKRIETETSPSDTVALNFLKLYHQKEEIDPLIVRTFDVSLILYAEHDFNASTFNARVTVSTRSDFYSGITSAIGTLRGPLHGGANEAAMRLLENIHSVEESNTFLENKWKNKELIMGFGHRIYKKDDPRSNIIKEYSIALSKTKYGRPTLVEVSINIEKRMIEEKKIYPNLDFFSASAYNQCGIHT